jgi:hypothetical protein
MTLTGMADLTRHENGCAGTLLNLVPGRFKEAY